VTKGIVRLEEELEEIRWKAQVYFRCLGYYFSVRWNRKQLGDAVQHVLGVFSVAEDWEERRNPPTPGLPHEYSLIDRGTGSEPRFELLYGDYVIKTGAAHADVLDHLFTHVNGEVFRRTGHFLMVHAGAVVSPTGEGVIFPGGSGFGKTTLVAALVQDGFGYLSDEVAAIDPVRRRLYPFPKTLNLKEGSFGLFPELRAQAGRLPFIRHQWHLRPDDIRAGAVAGPCSMRYVVFPRYEPGASTAVMPVSRASAVRDLMPGIFNLSMYGARALELLSDAVSSARSYRLVTGDLAAARAAVAALTSGNGSNRPA
jgi:hypothetical protein